VVTGTVVVGAVLVGTRLTSGGEAKPTGPTGTATGLPTGTGGATDTTPLQTNVGDVRVTGAALADEFCPPGDFPGPCDKPRSGRFLILTLEGWAGGLLTINVTQESNQAYVTHGGDRYDSSTVADEYKGVVRLVYDAVPAALAGQDVTLVWPGGQSVRLHVAD
jgi:hypothetical protein